MTFGWEAQIRLVTSDWSKTEKVRKKFIMKNFSNLLLQHLIVFPSKILSYKGPIRIVLAAILAWDFNLLRVGVC